MGKLIYLMNVSLDGFVETADHSLDWTVVDEELHTWFNDGMRELDASIYGTRLYQLMSAHWPTAESDPTSTPAMLEYARIWIDTPKFVVSNTLERVEGKARLVRGDVGEVLEQVRSEFKGDLEVGGPTLAAEFIKRGLVDEYRLVVHPVILGRGTPFFPALDEPIPLRFVEERSSRPASCTWATRGPDRSRSS